MFLHNDLCSSCQIQQICSARKEVNNTPGITFSATECIYCNNTGNFPAQESSNTQYEHVCSLEEILDRSQKIKEFYSNSTTESSSVAICPTCGAKEEKIYHCSKCGKAICQQCMIASADSEDVYCEDCW